MERLDKVDYAEITRYVGERQQAVAKEQMVKAGYVSISEAIVNRPRGGHAVLLELEDEANLGMINPALPGRDMRDLMLRRTWKIKCLTDQWGFEYKPGDVVEWKTGLGYRVKHKWLPSFTIQNMIRRGEEHKVHIKSAAVVDADGCITVGYRDAGIILEQWGMFPDLRTPVTDKQEQDRGESKLPKEICKARGLPVGTKVVQRNWRFVEVPPSAAQAMPTIEAPQKRTGTR
jgi:hypothetical protein